MNKHQEQAPGTMKDDEQAPDKHQTSTRTMNKHQEQAPGDTPTETAMRMVLLLGTRDLKLSANSSADLLRAGVPESKTMCIAVSKIGNTALDRAVCMHERQGEQ
jgi:hypothetical protein